MKIKIAGKEFDLEGTYGLFDHLMKKYPDMDNMKEWTLAKFDGYLFYAVWRMLPKKLFIFKPFWSIKSMINRITMTEMSGIRKHVADIVLGIERNEETTEPTESKDELG